MARTISIEHAARPLSVDNRISLRNYYRMADSLIRQANIYRNERNIIDLYVMLLRCSSLIMDTIPFHRDYKNSPYEERAHYKKKLINSVGELEKIKPVVQRQLEEFNAQLLKRANQLDQAHSNGLQDSHFDLDFQKSQRLSGGVGISQHLVTQRENQHKSLSLSVHQPKEETLLRHSFFGPKGLQRHQPVSVIAQPDIQYPSTLDLTRSDVQSLLCPTEVKAVESNNNEVTNAVNKITPLEEVLSLQDGLVPNDELSTNVLKVSGKVDVGAELSPPPVQAEVLNLPADTYNNCSSDSGQTNELQDLLLNAARAPVEVHISIQLMESFLRFAKSNTDKNLETCGVLSGPLKGRKFYVTTLIIPKQKSTENSCEMTNEEDVANHQIEKELFSLGWIHTHPTQTCFMSSIDVHTQYSYQLMLPEAIAIVMAPRDSKKTSGIFRLTDPGGMTVIKGCHQRGFHAHEPTHDGSPIYKTGTDVFMNPKLQCEVIDLR